MFSLISLLAGILVQTFSLILARSNNWSFYSAFNEKRCRRRRRERERERERQKDREREGEAERESTETKIFLVVAAADVVTVVLAFVVVSALSHSLRRLLISMLDLCSID